MQIAPDLSFAASMLFSVATGARLLHVARKTRGLPEAAVGSTCLVLSLAGALDALAKSSVESQTWEAYIRLSHAAYSVTAALTFLATQRLFRAQRRWAEALARTGTTGLLVAAGFVLLVGSYMDRSSSLNGTPSAQVYMAGLYIRLIAYFWLALEAGLAFRDGRRSLRFGLVEPLVVQQFLLWGLSAAAMFTGVLFTVCVRSLYGTAATSSAVGLYLFALLTLTGSSASWLAFFPPQVYVRWLESRTTKGPDDAE